ncbi:MAG TPA: hypothetical protein VFZ95_14020 [Steroidobacteraceae bacterium]
MGRIVAGLAIALLSMPGFAGVTDAQVQSYLRENEYWDEDAHPSALRVLYRAVRDAPGRAKVAGAADALATRWKIPRDVAAGLIETVIGRYEFATQVALAERNRSYVEGFRRATAAAPDAPEVWEVGLTMMAVDLFCDDAQVRDAYLARKFSETHYFELQNCPQWLPTFVRLHPGNLAGRFELARYLAWREPASGLAAARWMLDGIPDGGGTPSGLEMFATRYYWSLLGDDGLTKLLLEEGARIGPQQRESVLRGRVAIQEVSGHALMTGPEAEDLRNKAVMQWEAALVAEGRVADARAEFARDAKPFAFLQDAAAGHSDADLYERYVANESSPAWLWNLTMYGKSVQGVVGKFLAANHMESAASALLGRGCEKTGREPGWPQLRRELEALPPVFQSYWMRFADALARSRQAAGCTATAEWTSSAMSSRLPRFEEVALTSAQKAAHPVPGYTGEAPLPETFKLLRAERSGEEIRAVCISPAADPGGEVGRGGYWLLRSDDGGASWRAPVYLGFQYQQPYVVTEQARVSMFAPGVLRLEVQVAELDPDSITHPPISLRLRREATDLYVDLPLADLERDSDADGFTDLLEAKLATDPHDADTDRDGLEDGIDDFPQASARAEPDVMAPILVDMLGKLTGYERAAVIEPVRGKDGAADMSARRRGTAGSILFKFIEGDARQFAGLRVDGQVIVLSAEQVNDLRARYGPFYALAYTAVIDPQRTRAQVRWGAGWTGGTINYKLVNGRWVGEEMGRWMTRAPTSGRRISRG